MRRFRITILAVCFLLAWLGYADLNILIRNQEPLEISISELEANGAPQEWLSINGGYQDLLEAINMSGTMDITSFMVPLKQSKDSSYVKVWFETRDPQIVSTLKTYYFLLESEKQKADFLHEHEQFFSAKRQLIGMTPDNLVASSNQKKLRELLQSMNIPVEEDAIFISEGKQPVVFRGIFFAFISLVGIIKTVLSFRKKN